MLDRRPLKRTREEYLDDENGGYKFLILLPTGAHVDLILYDQQGEVVLSKLIHAVKKETDKMEMMSQSKQTVNWKSSIYFEDVRGNKVSNRLRFKKFFGTKANVLLLHDGSDAVYGCQSMWDLTPDTDLLSELPAEYTFESALADLINDLAHKDPFTIALKNFGLKPSLNESLPTIETQSEGRSLSLSQLEKEYQDWVLQMHEAYDEEVDTGEDTPVFVIGPNNKKNFGISSDVIRVHQVIKRKGISWRSGQHVKILKGADSRLRKDLYATLEYILLGGFQGEFGEEASLICRPLDCPKENGCLLGMNDGSSSLDIRGSKWFSVGLIDSGKFQLLDSTKWQYQLEKKRQNAPARIDILASEQRQLLGFDGDLPIKDIHVFAGYIPPREIVAVIRPLNFMVSGSSNELDQKFIVKSNLAMKMEITFFDEFKMQKYEGKVRKESKFLLSRSSEASSRSGFDGLYIFSLDGSDISEGLRNSGIYKFSFFVTSQTCESLSFCMQREVNLFVEPASEIGKLELLNDSRPISKAEPLCLSPYSGIIVGSQRNLFFPNPRLPTGEIPCGFLGFAVNMINIDTNHLSSVTSSGLGLRETLFYTLFGELQVYKTRVEMKMAVSILKADTISLDGGIVSRKGILSLGHWEPDILFPVVPSENEAVHMQLVECGRRIMGAEDHLKLIDEEYLKEHEVHKTLLQKFRKKDKLQAFYEGNGFLLDSIPLGLPFK